MIVVKQMRSINHTVVLCSFQYMVEIHAFSLKQKLFFNQRNVRQKRVFRVCCRLSTMVRHTLAALLLMMRSPPGALLTRETMDGDIVDLAAH